MRIVSLLAGSASRRRLRRSLAVIKRPLALGATLSCALATQPARASGHQTIFDGNVPLGATMLIVAAVLPSEVGAFVAGSDARFALGWAWQVPTPWEHHRAIGGLDYIPHADATLRGRLGYRYDRRYLIAGLAAAFDHDGASWSPEVGVKFLHPWEDLSKTPALHLLVRGDIAPRLNDLRGLTILLGWSIF